LKKNKLDLKVRSLGTKM